MGYFFLMFQQLRGNGSTVNLMPMSWEFFQLQFDTKQASVLEKKYPRKKNTHQAFLHYADMENKVRKKAKTLFI